MIISDSEIHFPRVNQPNILACLSQESYNKYYRIIPPGGVLFTDSHFVRFLQRADVCQINLPFYQTVMRDIGKPMVVNICMLGAIQALTEVIGFKSLEEVLQAKGQNGLREINQRALRLGLDLAKEEETPLQKPFGKDPS